MTNRSVAVVFVGAMLAVATSARAQDDATQAGFRATPEITPYVFLGSNGSSGVGAAVRWPLPNHFSVEVETSSRLSDVARLNANFSLLFDLPGDRTRHAVRRGGRRARISMPTPRRLRQGPWLQNPVRPFP